jgi:hypothetical protein
MNTTQRIIVAVAAVALVLLGVAIRVFKQYERGVQFRLGKLRDGPRGPGLVLIIPVIDRIQRVSLRIVTMPIQSQGIITRDNVSVDIAAVAYYRVKDAVRSVIAIEDVRAAINQIAQTTLRAVVGQHTLDEALAETERINEDIRRILDVQTEEWGVEVTLVAQGHPAAGGHGARDGQAGRSRAREAGQDHRRRGRGARGRAVGEHVVPTHQVERPRRSSSACSRALGRWCRTTRTSTPPGPTSSTRGHRPSTWSSQRAWTRGPTTRPRATWTSRHSKRCSAGEGTTSRSCS